MNLSEEIKDNIIAYAVLMQPVLVILQFLMIYVYNIEEEVTTGYRILLTAIPMSLAIVIGLKRRLLIFIFTYIFFLFFLLIESFLFPQNIDYIWGVSSRFLLPIIIPSILCLPTISGGIEKVEKIFYIISWVIVLMMFFFVVKFLTGQTFFFGYNMALSYALLLPTITLYKNDKWYASIAAIFLFICILTFGSRGALVVFLLYVIYDLIQKSKKYIFLLIGLLIGFLGILPLFENLLDSYGISSRTLSFLIGGNIAAPEGRDDIYKVVFKVISENLLTGVGIYGDRVILDEMCHNILLELTLNFGIIIAVILVVIVAVFLLRLYRYVDKAHKNMLVKYFIVFVMPLFFSDSYLISMNFGIFWAIVFLMHKNKRLYHNFF